MAIEGRLVRSYVAGAAIAPYRIVKYSGTQVIQAAAATDLSVGVSRELGADASGDRIDIWHDGIALIEAGGNVAIGAQVTSDASGKAVTAAPAQGVNNRVIGIALSAAVSGDIFDVLIAPCLIQGA